MNKLPFFTVSEVNNLVKTVIEKEEVFFNITVKGEISNLKIYPRAIYFTLKDQDSLISAVKFGAALLKTSYIPKDGDEVLVTGSIQVYEKRGNYQIVANYIELYGQGLALLNLQKLKEKLQQEGLFDASKKRPLPHFPKTIGIITGKDSAAYKDLIFNINRRYPLVTIKYFPTLVQGVSAPGDIVATLKFAYQQDLDLIIIGRGGGSEEDLHAFNDEQVARTVALSPIPTISAVGHEINQSITDLVADKYVSTPTGAAEAAVPDQKTLITYLNEQYTTLYDEISLQISTYRKNLQNLSQRPIFSKPGYIYQEKLKELVKISERLNIFVNQNLSNYENKVDSLVIRLKSPQLKINEYHLKAVHLKEQLNMRIKSNFIQKGNQFNKNAEKLQTLSPLKVLERGYSLTLNEKGEVITDSRQLYIGQKVTTTFQHGKIHSEIKEKEDE